MIQMFSDGYDKHLHDRTVELCRLLDTEIYNRTIKIGRIPPGLDVDRLTARMAAYRAKDGQERAQMARLSVLYLTWRDLRKAYSDCIQKGAYRLAAEVVWVGARQLLSLSREKQSAVISAAIRAE